jgi:hypothetical protein
MRRCATQIKGCQPPLVNQDAGHFVQERGDISLIDAAALDHFSEREDR